jgi:hypothetical protein
MLHFSDEEQFDYRALLVNDKKDDEEEDDVYSIIGLSPPHMIFLEVCPLLPFDATMPFNCVASISYALCIISKALFVFPYDTIYILFRVDKVVVEEVTESGQGIYMFWVL